jgi:class 3 adenylate cyclase
MASRRKATSRPARRPRTSASRGGAGLREQLAATARILRALASAPGNLQAVLDAVAEHAARVCGATDCVINRLDGDRLRLVAYHGPIGTTIEPGGMLPLTGDSASAQAAMERRTIHVPDLEAAAIEYPTSVRLGRQSGFRTMLAVPMVGEARVLGVITIRRSEARPFTVGQIAALETFADQAAIAIGHARLFQEVTERGYDLGVGVGIAQGFATIGAIGFEGRLDYGAVGTVTNLAARLCGEAKPGQILVSQRLLGAVEALVEVEPAGELPLKGFSKPVPAFNVVGLKAPEGRGVVGPSVLG